MIKTVLIKKNKSTNKHQQFMIEKKRKLTKRNASIKCISTLKERNIQKLKCQKGCTNSCI